MPFEIAWLSYPQNQYNFYFYLMIVKICVKHACYTVEIDLIWWLSIIIVQLYSCCTYTLEEFLFVVIWPCVHTSLILGRYLDFGLQINILVKSLLLLDYFLFSFCMRYLPGAFLWGLQGQDPSWGLCASTVVSVFLWALLTVKAEMIHLFKTANFWNLCALDVISSYCSILVWMKLNPI